MFKLPTIRNSVKNEIDKYLNSKKNNGLLFQSSLSFICRCVGLLIGFVLNIVIARSLPIHEAGLYFLAFGCIEVLSVFSLMGLQQTQVRLISQFKIKNHWKNINGIYKSSVTLVSLAGILVSITFYLTSPWLAITIWQKPDVINVLKAMSPAVVLYALVKLNGFSFQGSSKVVYFIVVTSWSISILLISFLLLGLAHTAYDLAKLFCLAVLITLIFAMGLWFKQTDAKWFNVKPFSFSTLRQSFQPLWLASMIGTSTGYANQFILGMYLPSQDIAIFTIALKIALLISFILATINFVVAPKFAALYAQGKTKQLQATATKATRFMVLFALPITIVILFFAEYAMWLFGKDYKTGANLLRILVIGQFINVATGSVGLLLTMTGHEKDVRNMVFITAPIIILSAIILIPSFGLIGAAISTAFASALQNIVAVGMVKKRLGFNTLGIWKRAL